MKPEIKIVMSVFLLLFTFAQPSTQANVVFVKNQTSEETPFAIHAIFASLYSCENIPDYVKYDVSSIKSDTCLNLYTRDDCEGNYTYLDVGDHPVLPSPSSPYPMSLQFLTCDDTMNRREIRRDLRLWIYKNENYEDLLFGTPITPNCKTLPVIKSGSASSVKSDICVILFSEFNCVGGNTFRTTNLSVNSLGDFNGKMVSFKPCDVDDVYIPTTLPGVPITSSGDFQNATSSDNDKAENVLSPLACECRCENGLSLMTGILLLIIFLLLLCIFYAFRERIFVVFKRFSRRDETMAEEEVSDAATKQWLMEIDEIRNKPKE